MIIAITGSIGAGKSTVSAYIRSKGYFVFDCDAYNRTLLEKGNKGYDFVSESFPEVIDNGCIDKKALAAIIFSDTKKKRELEEFLHPLIMDELFRECSMYSVAFAEVPLLFECGFEKLFDVSLCVVTDWKTSVERLVSRGLCESEAEARVRTQMSVQEKILKADKIIYNNCGLQDLYDHVDRILDELC